MIWLAFYIWENSEIDRMHVPPISEATRVSGAIEYSYVSTKEKKVSTLRGPAELADLQGALFVPTDNFIICQWLRCGQPSELSHPK